MGHSFERLVEEAQVSAEMLAERSGLPQARVKAILAGRWLASPAERAKLAEALGVRPDEVDWGHTMAPRNVRYHRFGFPDEHDDQQR